MVLGDFYLILQKRIRARVPSIKHVDWYADQFTEENEENELPFNLPAALIEFLPPEVIPLGRKKQAFNLRFVVHLGIEVISEARSSKSDAVKAATMNKMLGLLDDLHKALQNYNGTDQEGVSFGSISNVGVAVDHSNNQFCHHAQEYMVRLENRAAMDSKKHTEPPLNLKVTSQIL